MDKNLKEEIKRTFSLSGNNLLSKIFNSCQDDEEELYNQLKEYNNGLYKNILSEEEKEEEFKYKIKYIYFNKKFIDYNNISRIDLEDYYNQKKNQLYYKIVIIKKYTASDGTEEEHFDFIFNSEEERDKNLEILRGKLKMCGVQIL